MSEMDRRGFIGFVGRACAGTTLAATATAAAEAQEANATARKPQEPGVYRGRRLAQVAMPMGGLGAGNVAIGGGGNLRNWQIFNHCNPSAQLPATFFALWAKAEGKPALARLLQLDSTGKLPAVQDVEFRGEYPFAWLTYKDDALSPCRHLRNVLPVYSAQYSRQRHSRHCLPLQGEEYRARSRAGIPRANLPERRRLRRFRLV